MRSTFFVIVTYVFFGVTALLAQAPSGAISGIATDTTGRVIPAVKVVISNQLTGWVRELETSPNGAYLASDLAPGKYEVRATAQGFRQFIREAVAQAGVTTVVDLIMQVGANTETVTVTEAAPQIRTDAHDITGVVTRTQIEGFPLNGRNFLELAKLEPGAQQPARASDNRMLVPLLGAPGGQNGRGTRVTVDGGSIMEVGNGGSAMELSQEVVEEFQVSSANFDLATGVTAAGAVNIVTRSGGNQFHGTTFFFFRDHHFSAYPGLTRNKLNQDPFFQRRQFGAALGGPIRRDRAFFFVNFERNEQRGVGTTSLVSPDFIALNRITPSPTYANQFSARIDTRVGQRHALFIRHSHQDVSAYAFSSITAAGARSYPSAWTRQPAWADQSIAGVTSQFGANLVNDFRFSYFFISSSEQQPQPSDCSGCVGMGAPAIRVLPDLFIGLSTTDSVLGRRFEWRDVVSRQTGRHQLRFGADWELARGGRTDVGNEPATINLFSPQTVRQYDALPLTPPDRRVPLPAQFLTLNDILQLPLQNFTVGIGDPHVPQAGFSRTRSMPLVHVYIEDAWRFRSSLTLNGGLGWNYDMPFNADLRKPTYLAPLLGAHGLAPTQRNFREFSPSVGFAWSPRQDRKTVIRAGAGVFYDFRAPYGTSDPERVSLGPWGTGRGTYASTGIPNPLTNIATVAAGTLLDFHVPTLFTGAALLQALPAIRATLAQSRGDPNNRDFSVTNIELDKQGVVVDPNLPSSSAVHFNIGVQHEIASDFVINADFVYRRFSHLPVPPAPFGPIDLNHFNSATGPVLPVCTTKQRSDPAAPCSLGPISLGTAIGHARYEGLLVRAEKRFSRRWEFLASYAYSSNVGNNFNPGSNLGFDNNNWLANFGPLDRDVRHIFNVSGLVQLPKSIQVALTTTYNSTPPFSAYLGGLDMNGDGTTSDLLPGTTVNQFNRGLGTADLRRLVTQFNATNANARDKEGRLIPAINLPASFQFGDSFCSTDARVSRVFSVRDRWHVAVLGEAFNLFNVANLSGYSGDLLGAGFGQPTSRANQVFGSGGPRSFQLAARVSF